MGSQPTELRGHLLFHLAAVRPRGGISAWLSRCGLSQELVQNADDQQVGRKKKNLKILRSPAHELKARESFNFFKSCSTSSRPEWGMEICGFRLLRGTVLSRWKKKA